MRLCMCTACTAMDERSKSSSDSEDCSELDLSCSSSSFEEEEEREEYEVEENFGVLPYQYEPVAVVPEGVEPIAEVNRERLCVPVDQWCTCHHCVVVGTANECRCCRETPETFKKTEQFGVQCITQHPGFQTVCLDVYVQEAAYYEYRQRYGHYGQDQDIHMRFRYIAYRQLVRWCWGYLGKENRVVLPACAVSKIRDRFPSAEYVGFKYPNIDLL